MLNIKDTLSTVIGILFLMIEPINHWLISNEPWNWKIFIGSLLAAVLAYAQGKNADLSKKTDTQIAIQQEQKKEDTI